MDIKKYTIDGKSKGTVTLNDGIFGLKAHPQTVTDIVKAQINNVRHGTMNTKPRAEVAGGGRKPWRQKGTGRARSGSTRSPIWVGGGNCFGPKARVYDHRPPKKSVDRAIKGVLTELAGNDHIRVVEKLNFDGGKTKDVVAFLGNAKLEKVLIVVREIDDMTRRAVANLKSVKVVTPSHVNAYDLLKFGNLAIAEEAVQPLEEVLSK